MSIDDEYIKIINNAITELLIDFTKRPNRFNAEHGYHSFFASLLWKYGLSNINLMADHVQNEFATIDELGRSKRQHWDFGIIDNNKKLIAVIEFGLNAPPENVLLHNDIDGAKLVPKQRWKTPHYMDDLDRLYREGKRRASSGERPIATFIVDLIRKKRGKVAASETNDWWINLLANKEVSKIDWIEYETNKQQKLKDSWKDCEDKKFKKYEIAYSMTREEIKNRIATASFYVGVSIAKHQGAYKMTTQSNKFTNVLVPSDDNL